jgi:protein-tyrosine phosphatase
MATTDPARRRRPHDTAAGRLLTSVLTHPIVLGLKAPFRRMYWAFRGLGTKNPPLPERVESILFVCLGNICRSPFAAELAALLLRDRGRADVRFASAGIRPSQAGRSPALACEVSARYGLSLGEHLPQAVTAEMMKSHDVVVVMEWKHLQQLRAAYPEYRDRVVLLSLLDAGARNAYERYNIADPFGKPRAAYEECYDRIQRALRPWLEQAL